MIPEIRRYLENFVDVTHWAPEENEDFFIYIHRVGSVLSQGSPHFTGLELLTLRKAGMNAPVPPKALWMNIVPTLWIAEMLRTEIGPLAVGNGYRPKDLNKKVGGARFSTHVDFRALDLDLPKFHSLESRRALYECTGRLYLQHGKVLRMGLGLYTPHEGTRVHIDTGRRWGRPTCWEPQYAKPLLASIR